MMKKTDLVIHITDAFLRRSALCGFSAPPVTHSKLHCQQVTIMGLQHIKAMDRKLDWVLSAWTPAIYNFVSFQRWKRKDRSAPPDIKRFRLIPSTLLPGRRSLLCTTPPRIYSSFTEARFQILAPLFSIITSLVFLECSWIWRVCLTNIFTIYPFLSLLFTRDFSMITWYASQRNSSTFWNTYTI